MGGGRPPVRLEPYAPNEAPNEFAANLDWSVASRREASWREPSRVDLCVFFGCRGVGLFRLERDGCGATGRGPALLVPPPPQLLVQAARSGLLGTSHRRRERGVFLATRAIRATFASSEPFRRGSFEKADRGVGRLEGRAVPRVGDVSQVSGDDRTKLGRELRRPAGAADFGSSLVGTWTAQICSAEKAGSTGLLLVSPDLWSFPPGRDGPRSGRRRG